jgi:hypothetical protein
LHAEGASLFPGEPGEEESMLHVEDATLSLHGEALSLPTEEEPALPAEEEPALPTEEEPAFA